MKHCSDLNRSNLLLTYCFTDIGSFILLFWGSHLAQHGDYTLICWLPVFLGGTMKCTNNCVRIIWLHNIPILLLRSMANDREVLREVWDGRLPIKFYIGDEDKGLYRNCLTDFVFKIGVVILRNCITLNSKCLHYWECSQGLGTSSIEQIAVKHWVKVQGRVLLLSN